MSEKGQGGSDTAAGGTLQTTGGDGSATAIAPQYEGRQPTEAEREAGRWLDEPQPAPQYEGRQPTEAEREAGRWLDGPGDGGTSAPIGGTPGETPAPTGATPAPTDAAPAASGGSPAPAGADDAPVRERPYEGGPRGPQPPDDDDDDDGAAPDGNLDWSGHPDDIPFELQPTDPKAEEEPSDPVLGDIDDDDHKPVMS